MKLIRILLVIILLFNLLGCATNQHTVKDKETETVEQRTDGDSFIGILKFIGAVCLVGLFYPTEPEDEYDVYETDDGLANSQPKYIMKKKKK
jgi:hypothetical protein